MRPATRVLRPRGTSRLLVAGWLALATACATAPPVDVGQLPHDVDVVTSTRYYVVSTATVQQLRAGVRTVGPFAADRRWAGATQAPTRWTFGHLRRGMVCRLHNVRVIVSAQIRLPRWEPDARPDSTTLAWWSDLTARVLEHERGHLRIAVDGAREIAETLRPLEGSVSCDALTMRANGAARLILVKTRERQAEYDRVTGHGADQAGDSSTCGLFCPRATYYGRLAGASRRPAAGDSRRFR